MQVDERTRKSSDLGVRTKAFALSIVRLYQRLPESGEARVIGRQFLRSGTSVGAQYREAKRARSKLEFAAKIEGALQELEETGYWIELIQELKILPSDSLESVYLELKELTAMLVSSANTAKLK